MNGIRCDKLSTAVATVRTHLDRYNKDFDVVVTFLTQYINRKAPTPSVKVASITQTRSAKRKKTRASYNIFRGKIELREYFKKEYDSI